MVEPAEPTDSGLSRDHEADLFTLSSGAFRYTDRALIASEALKRRAEGAPWEAVVADFHRGGHWGYKVLPPGHPDTKIPLSADQKRAKEVRAFFWTVFQSLIVIKTFVMYFGLNYAMNPTPFYGWGLAISVSVSFASLLFFAIRKSKMKGTGVFD